ncbi:MAG: hypothetical protein ACE369_19415 [Roseovarius sp.]
MLLAAPTSIAILGYRHAPDAQLADIAHAIDTILQATDPQPRTITWPDPSIALIDRIGLRIAVGLLPPAGQERNTHLVLAVGPIPDDADDDPSASPRLADLVPARRAAFDDPGGREAVDDLVRCSRASA